MMLQMVFVPMISVIILVPVTAFLVGPIGIGVAMGISDFLKMVNDQAPALVGALIAGAVLSLVLAVGAAVLAAIFHRIVAPFDFGRRFALPAHSLTGCGGFMHRSPKEVS